MLPFLVVVGCGDRFFVGVDVDVLVGVLVGVEYV